MKRTHVSVGFYEKTNSNIFKRTNNIKRTNKFCCRTVDSIDNNNDVIQRRCLFLVMFSFKPNLDHFEMHARCLCLSYITIFSFLFTLIHCFILSSHRLANFQLTYSIIFRTLKTLLSEPAPDESRWPSELILLREKFTAKSQLEIAQLQIKHEEEVSLPPVAY